MSLDLAPEIESRVREYADAEGVSIDELIARTFPPRSGRPARSSRAAVRNSRPSSVAHRSAAGGALPRPAQTQPDETPAQTRERVQDLLAQWQAETGDLPEFPEGYKPLGELFAEWAKEDAKLTPQERQAERAFWEDYERERPNRPLQL